MNRYPAEAIAATTAAAHARLAAMIEDVEWLLSDGVDPEQVAARVGSNVQAIARRLYRAGRHDLARPFERLAQQRRRAA